MEHFPGYEPDTEARRQADVSIPLWAVRLDGRDRLFRSDETPLAEEDTLYSVLQAANGYVGDGLPEDFLRQRRCAPGMQEILSGCSHDGRPLRSLSVLDLDAGRFELWWGLNRFPFRDMGRYSVLARADGPWSPPRLVWSCPLEGIDPDAVGDVANAWLETNGASREDALQRLVGTVRRHILSGKDLQDPRLADEFHHVGDGLTTMHGDVLARAVVAVFSCDPTAFPTSMLAEAARIQDPSSPPVRQRITDAVKDAAARLLDRPLARWQSETFHALLAVRPRVTEEDIRRCAKAFSPFARRPGGGGGA